MKKLLFIPMLFACFMSMGQASAGGGGGKHFIGEKFGGGIVFYVTTDGLHGLIAETRDIPCSWYEAQDFISDPSNHSAAGKLFTDWRLPTRYELLLMIVNIFKIGNFAENQIYWSSFFANKNQTAFQTAFALAVFSGGRTEVRGASMDSYINYTARAIRNF